MQLDDQAALPDSPDLNISHLAADERRREIASLLAAGVLRLLTRPQALPEAHVGGSVDNTPEPASSDLDVSTAQRTHGLSG